MKCKKVGEVKVRKSGPVDGASLEVTIPKGARLFIDINAGDILEVFVDEDDKKIIYLKKQT